jgi:hypothetical protein
VEESDPAPVEVGGSYSKIESVAINDDGDVAFSATLANSTVNSAIFITTGGNIRAVLRSGQETPAGGSYKTFAELDFSSLRTDEVQGSFLLFRAELEGGSAMEGLFVWSPEEVGVIALAGSKSPRNNTYRSFAQPTIVAVSPTSGISFQAVFIAMMEDGRKSVISNRPYLPVSERVLETISTGDRLNRKKVRDLKISRLGGLMVSCVAEMGKGGRRFDELILVGSGFIIHDTGFEDGVKFPTLKKVKEIFAPPAISLQLALVAIKFKRGKIGLASLDVLGTSTVFAITGQPAPGLPHETIESFDPPLSNANFPLAASFWGASTVRLSSGRQALWFSQLSGGAAIEPKLLLPQDELNGQDSVLESFSAVKLNNNGTMLMRGKVRDGDVMRELVFVMDGLFDQPVP